MRRTTIFLSLLLLPVVVNAAPPPLDTSIVRQKHSAKASSKCTATSLPQFGISNSGPALPPSERSKTKLLPWGAGDAKKMCSGATCGCDVAQEECRAGCPPEGEPGWINCIFTCGQEYRRCGICCCCTPSCPDYC
jgi:hypothetical protein